MNLVFIHPSEKVKKDTNGNLYTDGSYSEDIWNMYLKVFSHITLLMREDTQVYEPSVAQQKFNLIPKHSISFVPLHNLSSSLKDYVSVSLRKANKNIIKSEIDKTDAVIVRIPGSFFSIDYARLKGKLLLAEVVGCPFDSLWNHSIKGKILAIPAYLQMRSAVQKTPNLIYVTKEFLQKRYPSNGLSIGCSDVRLQTMGSSVLDRRIEKIKSEGGNNKIIIGTASGVGVKYKGQQFIIRALYLLKEKGINCFEYQIAGAGDKSYLENIVNKLQLQDIVHFVGSIPHNQIFDWFNAIDVYAQPSLVEGLPRALVEAMSCALPCIGTKVGGIPELLNDEVLFNKGSVEGIQQVLLKIRNNEFRIQQCNNCYKRSLDYSIDKLEKQRIEFMQQVFKSGLK